MRNRLIAAAVALWALPAPAMAQSLACENSRNSPYAAFVDRGHDHRRYAPAAQGVGKEFTSFYAVFDDDDDDTGDGQPDFRFNPEFVAYELRGVRPNESGDYAEPAVSITRPRAWYEAPELAPFIASVPHTRDRLDDSYSGVGEIWNRGHLAMSDHAQRIDGEAACNTHHFWNASPQAAAMNQGPWLHLENYSGAAANKYRSVWVVAGPIFERDNSRLTIGAPGELPIEVPDAFFKVIIHEAPDGVETLAFIFEQPNRAGTPRPNGEVPPAPGGTWVECTGPAPAGFQYDHRPQLTSIREIERRTGMRFFVGHPNRQALVSRRARGLWSVEQRFWDPGRSTCRGQRGHP